jgi:integrase
MLRQLAHFNEWCFIQYESDVDKKWLYPEARLLNRDFPLASGEIDDYATYCEFDSSYLATQYKRLTDKKIPELIPEILHKNTKARRLEVVCEYLCWLTREYIYIDTKKSTEENSAFISQIHSELRDDFKKHSARRKTSPTIKSLTAPEFVEIIDLLKDKRIFPDNPIGTRNSLIVDLGCSSALRAGEILKLKTTDLLLKKHHSGKDIAYVIVKRRPNDANEDRIPEPSVKAGEGPVAIPLQVYKKLMAYIKEQRRAAVDLTQGKQTEYLFVNHRNDRFIGKPLKQRNLNKIFEKINRKYSFSIAVTPHVMRHSKFNDIFAKLTKLGMHESKITNHIRDMGRWSTASTMPALYTAPARTDELNLLISDRDDEIQGYTEGEK